MKKSKTDKVILEVDEVVRRTLDVVPEGCSSKKFAKEFVKVAKVMVIEKTAGQQENIINERELKEKKRKEKNKIETNDSKSKVNIHISCCTIQ